MPPKKNDKPKKVPDLTGGKLEKTLNEFGAGIQTENYLKEVINIFGSNQKRLNGLNIKALALVLMYRNQFRMYITPDEFYEIFDELSIENSHFEEVGSFNFLRYLVFFQEISMSSTEFKEFPETWKELETPSNLVELEVSAKPLAEEV